MGKEGASSRISLETALQAVRETGDPGEPFTASEVAETLDCSRRTAYDKLDALADRGDLRTKKTGARGRVWWEPVDHDERVDSATVDSLDTQFRKLVQSVSNYAIFALDASGHVVSWNDGAEQLKGYEAEEIIGQHFSTFYTETERQADVPEENLAEAAASGFTEDEGWRVRKDGSRFWSNVTITALKEDGELRGFLKVTRDMTDQHQHEEQLRREKERFESLVQEVEDYAIFMLDPAGKVQSWNSGIERIKGYEAEEIVGQHFATFYTEDDQANRVPERNLAMAARDGRTHDEGWRVRKDGTTFWADVTITALRTDEGDLRGFAKVTRDMTDQHEYEQRIIKQREELDELNAINAVIRDIDRTLVTATSREEIETAVPERIARSDSFTACWLGEFGPDRDELSLRSWAGVDEAVIDRLGRASHNGDGPVELTLGTRAIETGTIQTTQGVETDGADDPGLATLAEDVESVALIPLVYDEVEYGVMAVYAGDDAAFGERKRAVLGELGETISHSIAAIEHRKRERTLTTLHESTRQLLRAETREDIGEIVVSTATDDLEMGGALVYGFDTTDNVLEPLTASAAIEALDVTPGALTPGDDSEVWARFVDGESTVVDQNQDPVLPDDGSLGLRQSMVVPLGDHGVLVFGATSMSAFDPNTRKLVDLLGSTAQAAFNRVESEANLRERDEVLQEQNRRLQRVNELNSIVRQVDQRLVGATSREEIQRDVCEVLTAVDRFRLAWIGVREGTQGGLTPVASDGTGRGYLDSVSMAGDARSDDPAVKAARTGELTVVSNVADDLRAAPWRTEAFSREFQSVVSVPLVYGDHRYGVLTVYADRPGMFGEMEQSIFTELGYTIAHAINTVEMKRALFADQVTELEFRLPSNADYVLPRLAHETGVRVEFEGMVPGTAGGVRVFFTIRGGDTDDVLDVLEQSAAVESVRALADREDGSLFEVVVTGRAIASMLADHNASLRTLTATGDTVSVTIDVPSTTEVREFIEQFQIDCPGAEFVARRERDRPIETPEGFRSRLDSSLTDRQREALELAYYGGYFESPRATTGGDLADAMDVSQPTVTTHLRAAQRRLLDLVLDEAGMEMPAPDGNGTGR